MWSHFRSHFERNARRPLPDCAGPLGVPDDVRADVAASLAKFQLGESGEGRIAHEIDHYAHAAVDDDYRAALKLFVREEGRHGLILGHLVRALGGALLEKTWTERLFVAGRRIMGIRLKLVVLLAAEVIGVGFYRAIAERLDDGAVQRALLEICGDEEHHLAFHRAFFQRALARAVFVPVWWLVGGAACAVVLVDHRRTLRALRLPLLDVARTLLGLLARAAWPARCSDCEAEGAAPEAAGAVRA